MALHIRLLTGYFTNRKTIRLKSKLGEDAYWIMPRLWCYAANNQPNGDFSGYSPEEMAMCIEYHKNASSMLQALIDVGFIDKDLKVHNWHLHNSYHKTFSIRACKAANARWSKERKGKERKGKEQALLEHAPSIASSIDITNNYSNDFDKFWKTYPKKVGKGYAYTIWSKINPKFPLMIKILKAVETAKLSYDWKKEDGEFIPNPSTWLNQSRWDDELEPDTGKLDKRLFGRDRIAKQNEGGTGKVVI